MDSTRRAQFVAALPAALAAASAPIVRRRLKKVTAAERKPAVHPEQRSDQGSTRYAA